MTDAETREHTDTETGDDSVGLRVSASGAPRTLPMPPLSRPLSRRAHARLTRLLLAKSFIEMLLVLSLVAGFYYVSFGARYRGALEEVYPDGRISGWALDDAQPSSKVEVQLFIDDRFMASTLANLPSDSTGDAHRFIFNIPVTESGEHEARVYGVRASGDSSQRTLELIGRPLRFHIPARAGEEKP